MNTIKGLYRHISSNGVYKVLGLGRFVNNPNKKMVIYEQMHSSTLRGTGIVLPKGSIWIREYSDFMNPSKFKKIY